MPWAIRRSSSTDLTSEPSCSAWPRRCACSLTVELALDAVDLAVEQVDERPQQIGEIVLEARAGQHGARAPRPRRRAGPGRRRARARAADRVRPGRGDGRRARARRADARSARRRGVRCRCRCRGRGGCCRRTGHGGCLSAGGSAAPIAAFTAIPWPGAEHGLHPQGRSERRMARGGYFASRCKAAACARRRKIVDRAIATRLRAAHPCRPAPPADRRSGRPHARLFSAGQGSRRRGRQPLLPSGTTPDERQRQRSAAADRRADREKRVRSDGTS